MSFYHYTSYFLMLIKATAAVGRQLAINAAFESYNGEMDKVFYVTLFFDEFSYKRVFINVTLSKTRLHRPAHVLYFVMLTMSFYNVKFCVLDLQFP